jgi:hypothetical protein
VGPRRLSVDSFVARPVRVLYLRFRLTGRRGDELYLFTAYCPEASSFRARIVVSMPKDPPASPVNMLLGPTISNATSSSHAWPGRSFMKSEDLDGDGAL